MKILIVDDDKFSQKIINNTFKNDFETHLASDGVEGIAKAKDLQPDLIILDVEMPGMNGYEVCDQLKNIESTQNIPVVFLSGCATLREKMQGYEVGGDDYLVKPFEPEALSAKIKVLLKYSDQHKELHQQYEAAQKTAHIAMTGSSELGLAMRFMEETFCIHDYEALANALFTMTDSLALKTTLMFITDDNQPVWFSSSGTVSPLETQLLTMMHNEKRIFDFGSRTVISFPNVSLLVKNMPLDDMERYGRIKDLLPIVLGAINGKILTLNTEVALKKQSVELTGANEKIKVSLTELSASLQQNQGEITTVMRNMLNDLGMHLPNLGLEVDQEEYILNRIEQAIVESMTLIDSTEVINDIFSQVIKEMHGLSEKQNIIINDIFNNEVAQAEVGESNEYAMDVELF